MADMLAAITGMSPEECAGFLEMAGGDVETAVSLYYSMQDGGGGGGGGTSRRLAVVPRRRAPDQPRQRTGRSSARERCRTRGSNRDSSFHPTQTALAASISTRTDRVARSLALTPRSLLS